MTVYDSSVLIDYLDGADAAVQYVQGNLDRRAIAPPLVLFELYQGELRKSGTTDFDALDGALEWLTIVDSTAAVARAAATLQDDLHDRGERLAARDALIAGTAEHFGEPLAVADSDFDVAGLGDHLEVDLL